MMNTDVLTRSDRTETIPREATDARRNSIDRLIDPSDSYDGSDAVFRLLRLATWGSPLMNLGYFGFRGPLAFLNKQVTRPIQTQLRALTALTKTKLGRYVLRWRNPLFVSCTPADWEACESAVAAHDHVQRHSKYMAFVFEKP